uniref:BOS complex subunit NCLN n=2 Tax=Timema TaxID=61471 RepID=A0A7R9HNR0_9NEOP|nr:unnamed protein product [Timema cristinae]CAD7429340.1 unnamed protein product [Timema monikensis]
MLIEADELVELFKGYLPYYLLIVLPIFIIISPVCPVGAAHEFPVYRMQQYDLHGIPHGCRSAAVSLEARSVSGWGTSRHCVIARLEELTIDRFREIRARAGALLIVLPRDLSSRPDQEKQQILELEETMLSQDVNIPVYFLQWSPNLQQILEDVDTSFGKLPGYGVEEKLPTIALVAHYDSFGVAPELAMGADSNGSGVAMLMELARLFSQLYSSSKTHARHNIVFVLSAMGKLNYLGSKKWLEDQLDGGDGGLIQDASFVLCLDTLASNDGLYLHVSKPPKEGSPGAHFLKDLVETVDMDLLTRNTHILVESLARHIYNLSAVHIFSSDYLVPKRSESLLSNS